MRKSRTRISGEVCGLGLRALTCLLSMGFGVCVAGPFGTTVPGVIVAHSPGASGVYYGSAGLVRLPDGTYLAKHDEFGPGSTEYENAGRGGAPGGDGAGGNDRGGVAPVTGP
jgi:hypothetical protein